MSRPIILYAVCPALTVIVEQERSTTFAASNLAHRSNYIYLSPLLFPGNGGALIAYLHLYMYVMSWLNIIEQKIIRII